MCYSNQCLPLIWEEACFTFSTAVKPLNLLITSSQVLMQKYLESIYVHSPELPPKKFPAKSKLSTIVIIQTHFSIDQTTKSNSDSNGLSKPCATVILILLATIFIILTIILILREHHLNSPNHPPYLPDHHLHP